ncbi:MAG TPA: inositol monophosphatase family protein [Acidimicrobiia bacterium]|nr:inositol monophosphatase family protein [Acidimicrobiia bacterium]
MTKALDLDGLAVVADRAARAGGEIVLQQFGRAEEARQKSPGDWVSAADLASEQRVREILDRETGLPVFGEERGGELSETGWLVDPLDGTANFVHGFDAVGVSIGLLVDGVPTVGVVHAPVLGRTYSAVRGAGARRDGAPMSVSVRPPANAIVATGFPFRHKDLLATYEPVFAAALRRFEDLRRAGSASLDLCWTADGVFDGYFELRLGPWDVAAGAVIVREAGGVVTDWTGDGQAWLTSGNIVAGPPVVHKALLELIAGASSAS